ncbi:MAG: nucleotide pyrophosphatase [Planctomycetes bacterium]|jgi:predicted AlkP superfamily phosphohydrolase/phosphomutase|nr:nucleotide pyrophosphatase [Planctomycetota bacterium]MDP7245516.1 alkaline phosphatase family protein [Planctomycetota bacterium]|tara:strand:+ start:23486 stop:25636 length:2151 start_codon:yes stop_codon:yes gene_type:complete
MKHPRKLRLALAVLVAFCVSPEPASAYIGPGAGFAALSGGLVLVGALSLAIAIVAAYPVKVLVRLLSGKGRIKGKTKRLVIVGFDGMDPKLAKKFMDEGRMPNLKALADAGHFGPLKSAYPSMSPVAWSSFTTGVDASRHNIFDFITRDPCTYLPVLSSSEIVTAEKALLRIGKHGFFKKTSSSMRLLRKGRPWWAYLGDRKIFSNIIRVPITFPPEKFHGVCLSGMCVPDLKGTQGSFSFWTTDSATGGPEAGGDVNMVGRTGDTIRCSITGPPDSTNDAMRIALRVDVLSENDKLRLTIGPMGEQETVELGVKEYSDWITLEFKPRKGGPKVSGIVRFYCMGTNPEFGLYMTPIQIDPANPAMPISHPTVYSIYLAKKLGPFATLGLAEDTWALNERVIDEEAFWKQSLNIWEERRAQLFDALKTTRKGSVVCVFDGTDRVSHMFHRYLDPEHPANAGKDTEWGKDKVAMIYEKADNLIGELRPKLKKGRDLLMVISDHGFCQFKRGVNLNAWLRDNGYLVLKSDAPVDEESGKQLSGEWLRHVDWSQTRAFSLGLTGLFINRKARERDGIVQEGEELQALKKEIQAGLMELRDPKTGDTIFREVFDSEAIFTGPYVFEAPDLFMGYKRDYRNSWDCATGSCPPQVFSDNTKSWSGDHCIDPREVPGVIFSEWPLQTEEPDLMDLGPTALSLFGAKVPPHMQGSPLYSQEQINA